MADPSFRSERSLAQEVERLEQMLAAKKQALLEGGKSGHEREVFREAFRETYGPAFIPPAGSVPRPSVGLAAPSTAPARPSREDREREAELESLIAAALSRGIEAAADAARAKSPWLLDELHDRLQDRYYDELVQRRKLKAL